MSTDLVPRSLLHWDGFTIRLDLDVIEVVVRRVLAQKAPWLELVRLGGEGNGLEVEVASRWQVFRFAGTVRLSELRLHRRFLGCRIEAVRGPLSLPLPLGLAAALLRTHAGPLVRLDPEDRILLVDLRRYLPAEVEVRIADVRCRERWLEVDVAPGSVAATLASRLAGHGG
ncbi:MAG TPA: hypothetical protein P5234_09865 [Thermoanaerobaculaceae bacterium]|nr:hypothetical protein [Thermoanaerobaculaceae bacterium]HRS16536.1 hypothetical protein [Thermoanaerobaculaceae bacterium]